MFSLKQLTLNKRQCVRLSTPLLGKIQISRKEIKLTHAKRKAQVARTAPDTCLFLCCSHWYVPTFTRVGTIRTDTRYQGLCYSPPFISRYGVHLRNIWMSRPGKGYAFQFSQSFFILYQTRRKLRHLFGGLCSVLFEVVTLYRGSLILFIEQACSLNPYLRCMWNKRQLFKICLLLAIIQLI